MNRIQDKKLWFAVHCGTQQVKCPANSGMNLGLGLGIMGAVLLGVAFMAMFSHSAEASVSMAIIVPFVAGQRQSVTMKQLRETQANAALAILDTAGKDKREMTAEERTQHDSLVKDVTDLGPMITSAETIEAATADRPNMTSRPIVQGVTQNPGIADMPTEAQIVARCNRPQLLKNTPVQDLYKAGMWMLAHIYGRADAKQWCQEHGFPIQNATQEKTNTNGGFLVPDILENMIIDLREQYGVFRNIAKVWPMSSDTVAFPRRAGGLTAYAIGESTAPTASTKAWSQVRLTARKWGVLTRYTNEIAEDAIINVAEDLTREIAYAFSVSEDDAGFNGDGTSTYNGIMGIVTKFNNQVSAGSSTLKGALDAASGHDTFIEIDNTDLTNLMGLLPKYALGNAAWYISQLGFQTVFQRLGAAAGGNTIMSLSNGKMGPSYLGYPVVISQKMSLSTGDLSDKAMMFFGDMSLAATMGTRRGITVMASEHIYMETDEIGIRGTERFDINVHDIGDTSTAGPIVALIGE